MPRVEIPGVGVVNFPDNMPRDEIMSRAEAMQSKSQTPLFDPKDLSTSQLIKGGFSRGIEGLKGTAFDLLPALAGSMVGQKGYAQDQLQEYRNRMAAEEEINPTAYKGISDIKGIGDFGGFAAETIGEVAPDILSFLLGTGVGTVAGKAIAKKGAQKAIEGRAATLVAREGLEGEAAKKATEELTDRAISMGVKQNAAAQGAKIGSTVGLFGTSMGQSIPETLNSIYEQTQDLAPGLAITFGSLKGALDTYLPSKILKQLGPAGKDRVAAAMLEKSSVVPTNFKLAFLGEIAKTSAGEGLTESAQQAIDVLAAQVAGSKDKFFSQKNIDDILFAGLKGAVGGGTFGAPGAAMEASRKKSAAADEINRRAQAGEITQEEQQQQLLLLENNSFTPVALPDGTVVMTQAELDAYEQRQFDDRLAPQPADAAAVPQLGMSTPTMPVGPDGQVYPDIQTMRAEQERQAAEQEQQAFEARTAPQDVEGYQADMFPEELSRAQAQAQVQGLPGNVESALAGPPEAPAEFKTTLDAASLQGTGLRPQSGFYKKLLNKDLADSADQAAVRDILVQVRQNPNIADSTKQAVESLAMQAFAALSQQTSVVGPRGGIRKDVNYGRVQPRSPADTADRASVQVPEQQVPESTEGVGAPEQSGMAPAGSTTSELGNGTDVQPSALTQETPNETTQAIEPELEAAAVEPAVQAPVAEQVAEEVTPAAPKIEETREDQIAYLKFLESAYEDTIDPAEIKTLGKEIRDLRTKLGIKGKAQVGEGGTAFRGDVTNLLKDLRAALNKMGLNKVGINLEKALFNADGNPVQGFYQNKLIQVALKANDPTYTLNHEALHAMRELGFFSPADWNALSSMAKSTWIKKYDIEAKYPDLDKESQIEEAVAEAFATFQQQPPKIQSILTKVINNLRRLGNFLRGYGFKIADDVFGKAASGQLARDRADVIEKFNDYLDTTPNNEVKYQVAAQQDVFTGMDKVIRDIPNLSTAQKAAISEGVKRAGGIAKSSILALLPMHALGEITNAVFPGLGTKFNRLINERAGYQDTLNRGIDSVVEEAKRAIRANPEQRDAYNKIVNESTVNEVDPTKPRSEYLKDPEKLATYDKLVKQYNNLKKPWKELYVTMRDGYKQMYEEVKKAIGIRIDETDLDSVTKKAIKDSVLAKLAEKGMIEPYFGLGREGSYWLAADYKDKSGQQQYTVEAFKSDYERKTRMEQLQKMGASRIEPYANVAEINYRRAPTGSFVNSVLNIMETNKVDQKAIDEMMRLFLTTLPETAFAQSFQKRKGTAGFMEDSVGVFERKMRNTSHQVANMVYNPKLTGVVDQMREQTVAAGKGTDTDPARDNKTEKEYLSEFEKQLGFVLNPTKNDIGSILTSAAFTYTLGFNISSALVNMANIPMIVAPYLKGKYAEAGVARAIGDATKLFTGSGLKTNMPIIGSDGRTTGMRVMPSITNYAPDSAMGKQYATLIRIGNEQGQFNRSQLYEIINGDTRTGVMAKFNAISGWMFHHGERMNREVTLVATYNLELDRLKKQGITGPEAEAQAANTAIYTTELTNGGISAASAPRIAQNPIGKMFFMYKRYGISMYYMMFKTAKEALKGETPEARSAAFKQLGGIVGMSALMAGAQGIPMYGALSLVYSLFTDEDEDDLDAVTQKALGDFLYKGPVEYATNLAIAGRITLNDLIIRDAPKGTATTFSQQLAQALGGPVVGVADRIQRGYSKLNEGNVQRAMEDLLPSAISNGFKAYRYATEGTKTLRGDPITGEVSLYNTVGQALGFAPADYTRQLEINSREKGIDKVISTQTSKQKQKYYIAKREGDTDGMNDARDKLLELGAKHPGLGITPGTVNDIIKKSITAQERATREMINGARYNKKRLAEIKASLAEYED